MFDKRLVSLAPGAFAHVIKSVLCKWVALLCNIAIMAIIAVVLGMFTGEVRSLLYAVSFVSALGGSAPVALFGLVAALIALRAIMVYLAQREGDKAAFLAVRAVRQRVYDKLAELGPAYAEHVSTAEAVQTSVEGAQQLEVYFGGYLAQLFYAVLAPVTLFAFLVWQAGLAAAVLLIMVPVLPVSIMMVMKNAKRAATEYWDSYVDLGGSFLEALQGLTTLKIYSADGRWHERMNEESEGFRGATMKLLRVQLRSIMVMDLVAYGGAALGIIIAIVQLAMGSITFSAAFLVVYLSQEFFLPMRRLGSLFHTAMNGMAAANTMYQILDTPVPERGSAELDGAGDIEFDGVGYAYDVVDGKGAADGDAAAGGDASGVEGPAGGHAARQVVLADVCAVLPQGSLTAIVGASGSGKSTFAGIVAGRKEAYTGAVRVGGVELREATRASLSRAVTLVPTNGHLFEGTVRSNLAMAAPDATDGELWAALESCQLAAFVRANGGLDLPVSEGASNLSGGQRQRLCVARALLHDTPIYVFDEATSNVDVESERAIGRVIEGLGRTHTVIVVAHRLASIVAADQIFVFDDGRIVERGSHAELVAAGGVYANLWESQSALSAYTAADAGEPESEVRARAAMAAAADGAAADATVGGDGRGEAGDEGAAPVPSPAPAAAAEPVPRSGPSIMLRMVKLVRPLAKYLLLAIVLGSAGSLAATFVTTFGGYGLMEAIGVASAYPLAGIIAACFFVALCGIVRGPLHYGEQLANHYIAFRLLAHIRDLVFGAFRRLAPAKLEGRDKGDLVSLVTADIELLEVFYAHTISPIAIALVTGAVMLAFIGSQSPILALGALAAYLVVGVALPLVSAKLCGSAGRESRDGAGALSAYVLEGLRGISETIQYGQTGARSAGLRERTDALGRIDTRLKRRSAAVEGVADALVLMASLTMLCAALVLAMMGTVSFTSAFVCTFAFFSSFGPMLAVARLGTSLQNTLAAGARVLDLLDEEPETRDVEDGVDVAFDGAAMEQVDFAYGGSGSDGTGAPVERILSDVTIAFPAGRMVCITGRSGSGKSTLLKLLMRFWDVDAGSVTLSGEDVRHVNTASLRAAEGYLTQETHLFVGTLGENLRIARADATEKELDAACAAASILDLVRRLPRGYDTPVGELGETLSGGERQRIGLARIFLHDAPFILLDEPTSALDALNEAAVMRAIDERRAGKTIVLVSHRASTCAFADKFYNVEHGRLS